MAGLFGSPLIIDDDPLHKSRSKRHAYILSKSDAVTSSEQQRDQCAANRISDPSPKTLSSDKTDNSRAESEHSQSTSYYRGNSFEAVRPVRKDRESEDLNESNNSSTYREDRHVSLQSIGENTDSPRDGEDSPRDRNGSGGGLDDSAKRDEERRRRKHKKDRKHSKSERKERRRDKDGEGGDGEYPRKDSKGKSSRRRTTEERDRDKDGDDPDSSKHRHRSQRATAEENGDDPDSSKHKHRRSRRTTAEENGDEIKSSRRKERKSGRRSDKSALKASMREELKASKQSHADAASAAILSATDALDEVDDEIEQRRRRQREQDEKDKQMKQSIREQRAAVKSLRSSMGSIAEDDPKDTARDELEGRRRRQRAQDEKDRQMKQSIREQRDAAKSIRASQVPIQHHHDEDDELEQRRRRQREQEEKDRQMKQSIREQRDAAKSIRDSAGSDAAKSFRSSAGSLYDDDDDEFEQSRLRHREQDEKDRQMKESIKQQRSVARGPPSSQRSIFSEGDEEGFEADLQKLDLGKKQARQGSENLTVSSGRSGLSIREDEIWDEDTFDDQPSNSLVDMHMAQLRATAKIGSNFDENFDGEENDTINQNATLEDFERSYANRMSRRVSANTIKLQAWQEKYSMKKAIQLAERSAEMEWLSSFYRCDPRFNIMRFFDEVAREGGEAPMDENLAASPLANLFNKASVFTVWRPTSDEAIKNMMLGIATGKGLDIKGKSAKRGNISSYVPFIQIYEDPHKEHVRAYIKDGRSIRVFYQSEEARNEANEMMLDIKDFMLFAAEDARHVLCDEFAEPAEQELAMKHLMYDDTNLNVRFDDTYINSSRPVYGLEITERLFWEAYIMMQDCSRPAGTEWDIGRGSEPVFMDMNFKAIRHEPAPGDPCAVVYQMSKTSPMEPRMLLMAYEEYGCVKPVVSDFDCFLLGSRGVKYENPIPKDQQDLVKWSIKNISETLDERKASGSQAGWMETWFKVLKKAAMKGYYPKTPKYGNGDPKSYSIIDIAVSRLQETGCVRHGAECFNWFFPQEIDEQMLVISDTLPGNVKWKKVNVPELQELLITKIDEGFTFPINPKWVLCDPGWRRVYDKLLASKKPNVQDSLNCWLPPETGLREEIDSISERHPLGFEGVATQHGAGAQYDMLQDDLERYLKIQRAWRKLRLLLFWFRFARESRLKREEKAAAEAAAARGEG